MFTWIKNNKLATTGIAIVLIYVIVSLVTKEWNPMKWFPKNGAAQRRQCVKINQITGVCAEWQTIA